MCRWFVCCLAALGSSICALDTCFASQLTFAIDSQQSFITFSLETAQGVPISTAQTAGSDTTSLSGTMNVDLTATTIQFLTTSDTQFALQALPQSPLPGGGAGSAAAQYGLNVSLAGVGGGVVAARDYVSDTTSGAIPLVGNTFDATQTTLNLVVGNTDYNLTLFGNPFAGTIGTNFPGANMLSGGTITSAGGLYTLTLPVLVTGPVTVGGVTVTDVYSGQIVATAAVPEPSSLALSIVGMLLAVIWRSMSRGRHS